MKPRIKLILFSYAMLCLAGGISLFSGDSIALCESAMGSSEIQQPVLETRCGCEVSRADYPDADGER